LGQGLNRGLGRRTPKAIRSPECLNHSDRLVRHAPF
jgi:hypothetical protein